MTERDWQCSGGSRRRFLHTVASAAALALSACAGNTTARPARPATPEGSSEEQEAEVTPGEDLMQEHGILERILLVYDESANRLEHGQALDSGVLVEAAGIVRSFVEDYHERLEEEFVFPRFDSARTHAGLVNILRQQHRRGRELTDEIVRIAPQGNRGQLVGVLRGFQRMYRPHAAREDTVLFPAFRGLMGRAGYRDLGEQFEGREHALFGEDGFGEVVARVARLEDALGIHDLTRFTAP